MIGVYPVRAGVIVAWQPSLPLPPLPPCAIGRRRIRVIGLIGVIRSPPRLNAPSDWSLYIAGLEPIQVAAINSNQADPKTGIAEDARRFAIEYQQSYQTADGDYQQYNVEPWCG